MDTLFFYFFLETHVSEKCCFGLYHENIFIYSQYLTYIYSLVFHWNTLFSTYFLENTQQYKFNKKNKRINIPKPRALHGGMFFEMICFLTAVSLPIKIYVYTHVKILHILYIYIYCFMEYSFSTFLTSFFDHTKHNFSNDLFLLSLYQSKYIYIYTVQYLTYISNLLHWNTLPFSTFFFFDHTKHKNKIYHNHNVRRH